MQGLLTGDNVLPSDEDVLQSLVGSALLTVAMKAESLHLMTLSTTSNILRLSQGDYLIRHPESPALDDDLIDIDEELAPVVARVVVSMLSRDKGGIHMHAAERMILDYNAKTYEIIDQMQAEAAEAGIIDAGSMPSTEFTL